MFPQVEKLLLLVIVCCAFYSSALIHQLPSYVTPCKRLSPKLNECLLQRTEQVRPYLIKGIPELGVNKIEPFEIPEIVLEQGTQSLNFKATLRNVKIRGLSNYKFSRFDFNVSTLESFCDAVIGQQDLEGDYEVKGRVLIAPIEGKGKFTASIDNSVVSVYQKAEIYKKKGVDYLRPINATTHIAVGGPTIHLNGLYDGNAELNTITNKVIEDNVNELFQDIKPVIEKVVTNIVQEWIFRALQQNVPYDKLFLPEA